MSWKTHTLHILTHAHTSSLTHSCDCPEKIPTAGRDTWESVFSIRETGTTEAKSGIWEFWPSAGERAEFVFFLPQFSLNKQSVLFCNEDYLQVLLWATEKPPKERKRGPGLMATCLMHVDEFGASLRLQRWEFTPPKSWMISGQG